MGIDIKQTRVRLASAVGEAWAESYKRKIEAQYGIPFMTFWGSVELGAAAAECEARKGMHIFSDLVLLEVIDPETGKPQLILRDFLRKPKRGLPHSWNLPKRHLGKANPGLEGSLKIPIIPSQGARVVIAHELQWGGENIKTYVSSRRGIPCCAG